MMNSIIIGANFGDEGKGLITDFEARRNGSKLNVRFNGGAQAGHTVVSENKRHIFSHVGASSFAGTETDLVGRSAAGIALSVMASVGFSGAGIVSS
jgi:adenylosuccinate synthase